ncbi:hypothetical protein HAX54_004749 [Datura stramonium]|uniref:Uncharacterized protein n=1 Tax=Datura stramonium TaxID=4076 RepID=A0ABS8WXN8_DATST|nr:hypothetical protein [Datura stramonium]
MLQIEPKTDYYESVKNRGLSVDSGSSGLFFGQVWPELRLVRIEMRGKERNGGDWTGCFSMVSGRTVRGRRLERVCFFTVVYRRKRGRKERFGGNGVAGWEKREREEEDGEGKIGGPWCRVLVWCGNWIFTKEEGFWWFVAARVAGDFTGAVVRLAGEKE